MNSEIFDEIIEEYEKQRSRNKRDRDMRVREAYEKVPQLKEIEDSINKIGANTLREILSEPNRTDVRDAMKAKFKVLRQRKKELLAENNIPEDFDRIRYKCLICEDTGYIAGKGRCGCFRQKVAEHLSAHSNMSEIIKKNNFDNFNENYYGKNLISGYKKSPFANMQYVKKACESFIENFDKPGKSLIFIGDTGLGKTFMSGCIARELMALSKAVVYIRAIELFKMFDDERFGRAEDGTENLYDSDLLIIDDLGTEVYTKNNNAYILNLISRRTENNKKMIISTNINFEGLEEKYTKRFTSRLLDDFLLLYFYGEDIRKQKMMKRI